MPHKFWTYWETMMLTYGGQNIICFLIEAKLEDQFIYVGKHFPNPKTLN